MQVAHNLLFFIHKTHVVFYIDSNVNIVYSSIQLAYLPDFDNGIT